MIFRFSIIFLIILLVQFNFPLFANNEWRNELKELKIGLSGGENEADRLKNYECWRVYLEDQLQIPVKFYPASDVAGIIHGLLGKTIDYASVGPSAYAAMYIDDPEAVEPVLTVKESDGSEGYKSAMYVRSDSDIYSLEDLGDLTYPYKIVDANTETIKNIVENKNDLSNKIINAKKPLIIIGQSALKIKSSKYIFEELKKFLKKNNKINNEWNSLNIVSNNASTVGSFDLDIINSNNSENTTLERIKKNDFKILFLFGQDNLKFNKKNEFIIYIGSHGDKGAEMADIILPGAAYTEQDGYYTNLEGKIQKAYQASYPPAEAKEDWIIINELSNLLKRKKLYKNKNELIDEMFKYLNKNNKTRKTNLTESIFINEKILLDEIDYYYSNVISRSSKTMTECRNEKIKIMNTGTEG